MRPRPSWWDWDLELSVHVELRMLERGVTEVELRTMFERARGLRESHVEGRFVVETRHEGSEWEVVVEPDFDLECIAVVTVYNTEDP
jgi:hypothetical protein